MIIITIIYFILVRASQFAFCSFFIGIIIACLSHDKVRKKKSKVLIVCLSTLIGSIIGTVYGVNEFISAVQLTK